MGELTNIKIPKQTARLARTYCIFNNKKFKDYVAEVLNRELSSFQEALNKAKTAR